MTELRHIVRICDTDLKGKLKIERSIRGIKGVSYALSRAVRVRAGIPENSILGELSDEELKRIEKIIKDPASNNIPSFMFNRQKDYDTGINKHLSSTELELETRSDIARMKSIKSYKGI